jgi:XTP/dITP diphosphohydrolase
VSEARLTLLIGTHNRGKAVEIAAILDNLNIDFLTLQDIRETEQVIESGQTYQENAILKAEGYAQQSGLLTLADDSGLEVDALQGAPGVISARYAGPGASDQDRIKLLLEQLATTPEARRTARFVSVVALAHPQAGTIKYESGVCEGRIISAPRGTNGFGYDPIFVPEGYSATFAELPAATKDVISHRAKALRALRPFIGNIIGSNLTHGELTS